MSTSYESKDSLVRGAQLSAQSVHAKADLEAGTADVSFVAVSGGSTATVSIAIDVSETVSKVIRATVHNNKTGTSVAQTAAPTSSSSVITIADIDASASDLADCSIEVVYEVE